jgi:CRP-like cAMP-binding protein
MPRSSWIFNAPARAQRPWGRFASLGTARRFEKGTTVYAAGDPPDEFYYLRSGRVQLHGIGRNGRRRILAMLEPGSTFGETACLAGLPRTVSATVLEDAATLAFAAEAALAAIGSDPAMLRDTLRSFALKQRSLRLAADDALTLSTRARVALLLAHLGAAYGRRKAGDAPETRRIHVATEQLAAMLGISRVTLSRALSDLSKGGAIARDKRELLIVDAVSLAGFSSEENVAFVNFPSRTCNVCAPSRRISN